jgi:hypothetical protein
MSWHIIEAGSVEWCVDFQTKVIPFEIKDEGILLLKISVKDYYYVNSVDIVDLSTNNKLTDSKRKADRNTKKETYLYPRPKSGNYNMISVARQNEYEIAVLDASNIAAPSVIYADPFRLHCKAPPCTFARPEFFMRKIGRNDFTEMADQVDPGESFEVKYNLQLNEFPGITSQYSPVTTITPAMNCMNDFTVDDYLDLGGFLTAHFELATRVVRIDLEVNLDGKNWIPFAHTQKDRNRTTKHYGEFYCWQLPRDIFDTLTCDTVIDWRFKYQPEQGRKYVAYSDTRHSLITKRKNFIGKEFITDTLMVQYSTSEVDEGDGYAWTFYDYQYWNLYLFPTGKFLYIKEAEVDNEFYRTGNFTVHEKQGNGERHRLVLYPKSHNGRPIKQLKFETVSYLAHPLFSVKDMTQLILQRYLTKSEADTCATVCRYFYETMRNGSEYSIEAELKLTLYEGGISATGYISAWGHDNMFGKTFITPKMLKK